MLSQDEVPFRFERGICCYCHIRPVTVPFSPDVDPSIGACQTCEDFRAELLAGTLGIKRRLVPRADDVDLVMARLGVDHELAWDLIRDA